MHVTAANEQERAQVGRLADQVPNAPGDAVEVTFGDPGDTGVQLAQKAAAQGIQLAGGKLPEAKKGVVLWLRRWVVERSVAWAVRVCRLGCDDERVPDTLRGVHYLVFAILMLTRVVALMVQSA